MTEQFVFKMNLLTMDRDGKVKGKTPVFNDILAYVSSRMKFCNPSTLVEVILTYYTVEELREARDILYFLIDPNAKLPQPPEKFKYASALVYKLEEKIENLNYIFFAMDLNNLPCVDVIDRESVALFIEQHKVQNQLQEVLSEQADVKAQLASINEQLERIRDNKQSKDQTIGALSQDQHIRSDRTNRSKVEASEQQDSTRSMADIVKGQIPKGFTMDPEGFMSREKRLHKEAPGRTKPRPRNHRPMVTGVRTQDKLKPTVSEVRIFATRFNPDESEMDVKAYLYDLIGSECSVEKIKVRTTRHASFLITASRRFEQVLLDPKFQIHGKTAYKFATFMVD